MIFVEQDVEPVLPQIGGVFGNNPCQPIKGLSEEDPANMRPPHTVTRGMRIAIVVGLLMVDAMGSDPGDGTAFERKAAANRQKIFQETGRLVGAMGVQAMIAQTDAEACSHPIEENGDSQISPTEDEKRRDRPEMEQDHGDRRSPVQPLVLRNLEDLVTHLSPIMLVIPT